jgi:hypothetical protein
MKPLKKLYVKTMPKNRSQRRVMRDGAQPFARLSDGGTARRQRSAVSAWYSADERC